MKLEVPKGLPAKLIVRFIIPIIIGNIFQRLYNMADTIIVGRFVGVGGAAFAVGRVTRVSASPTSARGLRRGRICGLLTGYG